MRSLDDDLATKGDRQDRFGDARGHGPATSNDVLTPTDFRRLLPEPLARRAAAAEWSRNAPTMFDDAMIAALAATVARAVATSEWRVAAATIERTHLHVVLTPTPPNLDQAGQ